MTSTRTLGALTLLIVAGPAVGQNITYERCSPNNSGGGSVSVTCNFVQGYRNTMTLGEVLRPGLTRQWIEQEFGVHSSLSLCGHPTYSENGLKLELKYENEILTGYVILAEEHGVPTDRLANNATISGFGFSEFPNFTISEIYDAYTNSFEVSCVPFAQHGNGGGSVELTCSHRYMSGAADRLVHRNLPDDVRFSWTFEFPSAKFDRLSDQAQMGISSSYHGILWGDNIPDIDPYQPFQLESENPSGLNTFLTDQGAIDINMISVGTLVNAWSDC